LGLSIDYEFPTQIKSDDGGQQKKSNKPVKSQVTMPVPVDFKLNPKLRARLDSCSRNIKLFSRINIKIKAKDISTNLHHLVWLIIFNYKYAY
jgi:hypothetical protein